jgi:hypothetical protein
MYIKYISICMYMYISLCSFILPLSFLPDRYALWSRAEDDLLVKALARYSTSDVLFRDWSEVALELLGRLPQQCKERYRLADDVVELTYVFLRVTFRGSPFLRSSYVLTKDADSADSARPIHYSTSDRTERNQSYG